MQIMYFSCGCEIQAVYDEEGNCFGFKVIKECGFLDGWTEGDLIEVMYDTLSGLEDGAYWGVVYSHKEGSWYDRDSETLEGIEGLEPADKSIGRWYDLPY